MYRRHGEKLSWVFLGCDLALTSTVWFAAYGLRYTLFPPASGIPEVWHVAQPLPLLLLMATLAYRWCGLYDIHRLQQLPREVGVICRASALVFVLAVAVTFIGKELYQSRLGLALFGTLNAVGLIVMRRVLWRLIAWLRQRGLNHGRGLIVGQGRRGRLVAQTLIDNHWTGLAIVGCVDRPSKVESIGLPRLGDLDQLAEVVQKHDIDHIFVALPIARYAELPEVYRQVSGLPVEVQLIPDIPNLAGMRVRMQEIDGVAFLSLREHPNYGGGHFVKRAVDVVGSLALLVLLSPLLLLLALFVKLTSPGPIFFFQPRAGLGGRKFNIIKFRTMRVDAERSSGPIWASVRDQRCTWLGGLLRKWSLDELPQLLNVLVGDMSLVGPRPERPVFIAKFREELPAYAWRQQVKAGLTGWAQVNGWRGNTSLRRRLEHDLYYINHWSLWLDIKILLLTLWSGWRHRNAY